MTARSSRLTGPPLSAPRHDTLLGALDAAAGTGHGLVFVDPHERESRLGWAEIRARSLRCAVTLRRLGVAAGDRVALIVPTGPGFVDAFFGALYAGAVPVPLYPPLRLGRFDEYRTATAGMLAAVGARLVIADLRTRALLGAVVATARPALGCRTPDELLAGTPAGGDPGAPAAPDALALIQFSSGSTAMPRPVALTHRQILAQCEALRIMISAPAGPPRTGVSWLPLYHDMGLIGCLLGAVTLPGTQVLIAPEQFLARPALWLRAIARHGAGISAAPNFGFAVAAKRVRDEDMAGQDLSRWRLALCGAEPVSVAVLQRFAARFARFGFDARALLPVYGLAEAALAVTAPPPGRGVRTLADCGPSAFGPQPVRDIVSVGGPVAGTELEVRSADGRPLPAGRAGAIAVRGASVMTGYFGQAAATAAALRGGWLDTGDVGLVADGELYVCGRVKDVIIVNGANRHPAEFEVCLAEIPGLRPGCAVALGVMPPGGEGEALIILAERARDSAGDDDAVIAAVGRAIRERTGVSPRAVTLLPPGTLPRTSSGKPRRAEAKRRYLEATLTPPTRTGVSLVRAFASSALAFVRLRLGL
jgi:fatty-acyl-CoA synthase